MTDCSSITNRTSHIEVRNQPLVSGGLLAILSDSVFSGLSVTGNYSRSVRQNVGILRETYCNNVGNSEQNEQMKNIHPCGQIMCKFMKMLVFRKEMGVEHRVIRNQ
jgi:hypothetical protein